MADRRFFGDVLTTLFERRRTAPTTHDDRSIEDLCRALLNVEGEVVGVAIAQAILDRYASWDIPEKRAFFRYLNDAVEIDLGALDTALSTYRASGTSADYQKIAARAEAPRQELLRRLNQAPGATHALVKMRADLLAARREDPALARTDFDFQHLLRSWFNRGFLVLRQISWETPANILEKIVEYESVHTIHDWDDLRRRLYPQDRRCFAFFHPAMPDEPLIFVEIALTQTVPSSIQGVLTEDREMRMAQDTKVAVFYSISNCQAGLRGISFGNLLIKQVVAELRQELPGLETFVTLSPIPKLMEWVSSQPRSPELDPLRAGTAEPDDIHRVAAQYLLNAKTDSGAPFDPVARFHLGNGAQIYAVHGAADLSKNGKAQSGGAMVNYEYDLNVIEQNHERFVQSGEISTSSCFAPEPKRPPKKRELRA